MKVETEPASDHLNLGATTLFTNTGGLGIVIRDLFPPTKAPDEAEEGFYGGEIGDEASAISEIQREVGKLGFFPGIHFLHDLGKQMPPVLRLMLEPNQIGGHGKPLLLRKLR